MTERRSPGVVRDAITTYLGGVYPEARDVRDIHAAVNIAVGSEVPASSVRSYLRLNTPRLFMRIGRGQYKLSSK
jgi:hypothetical protein